MRLVDPANMELLLRSEIPQKPPSVNNYLKRGCGVVYKKREARQWQEDAAWIMRIDWGKKPPYEGRVYVEVLVYSLRPESFDADNRLKTAQDAIQMAGVIRDDRQAARSAVEKIETAGEEKTVIEVWAWKD